MVPDSYPGVSTTYAWHEHFTSIYAASLSFPLILCSAICEVCGLASLLIELKIACDSAHTGRECMPLGPCSICAVVYHAACIHNDVLWERSAYHSTYFV